MQNPKIHSSSINHHVETVALGVPIMGFLALSAQVQQSPYSLLQSETCKRKVASLVRIVAFEVSLSDISD